MRARRTAAAATALAALTAGTVLLASAGTAAAQHRPERGTGPVPGMTQMHQQVTQQYPGMARMHELHVEQNSGMARMHQFMTDGPR